VLPPQVGHHHLEIAVFILKGGVDDKLTGLRPVLVLQLLDVGLQLPEGYPCCCRLYYHQRAAQRHNPHPYNKPVP